MSVHSLKNHPETYGWQRMAADWISQTPLGTYSRCSVTSTTTRLRYRAIRCTASVSIHMDSCGWQLTEASRACSALPPNRTAYALRPSVGPRGSLEIPSMELWSTRRVGSG